MYKHLVVSLLLVVSMLISLDVAYGQEVLRDNPDYIEGLRDGKALGTQHPSIFLAGWGVVFGPFAVLNAFLSDVEIPDEVIFDVSDRSEAYGIGFEKGFTESAKNQKVMYGLAGWATWVLLALLG